MDIGELSQSTQDYLKAVWNIEEWSGHPAATSDLAGALQVSLPAISAQVKKLSEQGLLTHAKYGAITLTDLGRDLALAMVRRHRLIETFLVEIVGSPWDEVHADAERLEHAISDTLLARFDDLLGHPTHDPHGDPIPGADGSLPTRDASTKTIPLSQAPAEVPLRIVRVHDSLPGLLDYLSRASISVGATVKVNRHDAKELTLQPGGRSVPREFADRILVAVMPVPRTPTTRAE